MLGKLILLFTVIPIIELFLLFRIAKLTSATVAILLVLLTGIAGAYLAKAEGRSIIKKIQADLQQGRMPANELINGLCVLVGGALLLTPGIITDLIGFSLVIPFTRSLFKDLLKEKMEKMLKEGQVNLYYHRDE